MIDTISLKNPEATVEYDEDAYADTTEKHIYDTSTVFFTWKTNNTDPYSFQKIQQRSLPDSTIYRLKNSEEFWYIPAIEKIETRLKNDPAFRDSLLKARTHAFDYDDQKDFTQQAWFRTLLWCIIIGIFIAALGYFLLQNRISLFSRESQRSSSATDATDEHGDIFHIPYAELLQKAEKEENFRGAIRLLYLQTLKFLSETNIIQYQPDYTNLQYIRQLYQTSFYEDFLTVTRHYEFIWYGKFDIAVNLYGKLKDDFFHLQNKIAR